MKSIDLAGIVACIINVVLALVAFDEPNVLAAFGWGIAAAGFLRAYNQKAAP